MDDLIGRRVANAGVFRAAATQIPGIFPQPPLEQEPFHRLSPGGAGDLGVVRAREFGCSRLLG
jgi:hypothetical protein